MKKRNILFVVVLLICVCAVMLVGCAEIKIPDHIQSLQNLIRQENTRYNNGTGQFSRDLGENKKFVFYKNSTKVWILFDDPEPEKPEEGAEQIKTRLVYANILMDGKDSSWYVVQKFDGEIFKMKGTFDTKLTTENKITECMVFDTETSIEELDDMAKTAIDNLTNTLNTFMASIGMTIFNYIQ